MAIDPMLNHEHKDHRSPEWAGSSILEGHSSLTLEDMGMGMKPSALDYPTVTARNTSYKY